MAFILFGGNDSQGILGPNGEAYAGPSDPRWREEYARRVAGVMDILRADDRIVFWVALPPMRDDGFDGRADIMNEIYREAAESRPWMTYLDTDPIFGDDDGEYVERKPDASGDLVDLRQEDGVHFSQPGATRLARVMLDLIDEEIQASRADAVVDDDRDGSRSAAVAELHGQLVGAALRHAEGVGDGGGGVAGRRSVVQLLGQRRLDALGVDGGRRWRAVEHQHELARGARSPSPTRPRRRGCRASAPRGAW